MGSFKSNQILQCVSHSLQIDFRVCLLGFSFNMWEGNEKQLNLICIKTL